jgi:hypothetical protein
MAGLLPWASFFDGEPPAGGDLASHIQALERLADAGAVRAWDAGQLAGEPLFVHCPTLPFLVASLLGKVPLASAFDPVAVLPLVLLTFCVGWGQRRVGGSTTLPTNGFAAAAVFGLDESCDRWGGHALSAAMGQFCHGWALCLLVVALGLLLDGSRRAVEPSGVPPSASRSAGPRGRRRERGVGPPPAEAAGRAGRRRGAGEAARP